jgi:hypothetical protein
MLYLAGHSNIARKRIGAGVPPGLQIQFEGDWQPIENVANPLFLLNKLPSRFPQDSSQFCGIPRQSPINFPNSFSRYLTSDFHCPLGLGSSQLDVGQHAIAK